MITTQISLCITNYNRYEYLFESFEQVLNDNRIGEIVIVDDCSDMSYYAKIEERCRYIPKVKLFRNEQNLGCYANKREAVSKASFEYVIIFDSDNVIGVDYLDTIYKYVWHPYRILSPDYAKPVFDYREFSNRVIDKNNAHLYTSIKGFDCLINTMNYFVHRDTFLQVYEPHDNIKGADSIYLNYLWLKKGNAIYVIHGLQYFHRVEHDKKQQKSNYISYAKESEPMCAELLKKISELK